MPAQKQFCHQCNTAISGRVDKKFCSDQCRSTYHNQRTGTSTEYMRNVTAILRKNRQILSRLYNTGNTRIGVEKLKMLGFNFSYFTTIAESNRVQCFYCYEHGYGLVTKDECVIVVMEEYVVV